MPTPTRKALSSQPLHICYNVYGYSKNKNQHGHTQEKTCLQAAFRARAGRFETIAAAFHRLVFIWCRHPFVTLCRRCKNHADHQPATPGRPGAGADPHPVPGARAAACFHTGAYPCVKTSPGAATTGADPQPTGSRVIRHCPGKASQQPGAEPDTHPYPVSDAGGKPATWVRWRFVELAGAGFGALFVD